MKIIYTSQAQGEGVGQCVRSYIYEKHCCYCAKTNGQKKNKLTNKQTNQKKKKNGKRKIKTLII
jgi:hypothetical protein